MQGEGNMRIRFQNKKRRKAATLVEATCVLSACLLMLLAIFEYGRFVMLRHVIDTATREGARVAATHTQNMTNIQVQAVVQSYTAGLPVTPSFPNGAPYKADPSTGAYVDVFANAGFGDPIAMEVRCTYAPMLPGLSYLVNPVAINAKVVMRSEAN
jgi:Flp pilus assembly protein TadG